MKQYDVIVIGAGVIGCAIARELSRRERRIAVLERASDICEGTSKANSGIVHAGHDAMPGTMKARMNVLGNARMETLSKELDFPFRRNGSLVIMFEQEDILKLEELKARGEANGVQGLELLTPRQVWEREPNISREIAGALYAPTGGIVCTFGLTIALAENAVVNGVDFFLNHEVTEIIPPAKGAGSIAIGGYRVTAAGTQFEAPVVINAAGVCADLIHNMVSERKIKIVPRRGEYRLMDKNSGSMVDSTIFQLPSRLGKGILVTPTVHGNLLVGPTAEDIPDKEDVATTAEGVRKVMEMGAKSVPNLDGRQTITSFAGLRAHLVTEESKGSDFLIEEVADAKGFFDVAGIESPGLTAAPAIGEYVAELVNRAYPAPEKADFVSVRKGIPSMANATDEQRRILISKNPSYANVICRCELVTEGEIVEAIHRPLGATTLDGVKRRTRAGMGRCQSGFCSPKVVDILARELDVDKSVITKNGTYKGNQNSNILTGYTKGWQPKGEDNGKDVLKSSEKEVDYE
ncbi:MAG: NAD(P)/FAD-dependent oxidoreductase [Lachnospiraceae bacterium]|nr:NAD(P)/FAD-dependent oxidoreductase [Lachnospiraceae bacterium]